jgi:hypothetical protein
VLARIKNNLAPPSDAWVYRADAVEDPLHPGKTQPHIVWLRTERLAPDDVLRSDDARRDAPALRDAAADLRQVLAEGARPVGDIKKAMDAAGHSWRTVTRASERPGIVKRPVRPEGGFGIEAWEWELPSTYDFVALMRQAGIGDVMPPHEDQNPGV